MLHAADKNLWQPVGYHTQSLGNPAERHDAGLSSRAVSASDCGARGPRFESHGGWLFIATAAAIYSLGHGLCTFTAMPESTQPTTLRATVK